MTNARMNSAEACVLLLSADIGTARALQRALDRPWTVEVARDGFAAVSVARRHPAVAVVADAHLLQEDDWRLLRVLREDAATAHSPIIAIAPAGAPGPPVLCLSAGVDDYLVNPISVLELETRVMTRIELGRVREDPWVALEAVHRHLADAEAANQAKDRVMAILGHELRNPLSAIRRALELMPDVGDDSRGRDVIERQVCHMIRLVDDLLDVARIQGGKMVLRRQRDDFATIVKRALETVDPLLQERQQRVRIDVPIGLYAMMDSGRMSQVVSNLLDNAAKYSDVRSLIVVTGERLERIVRLKVTDQGMGIDAAMLEHVFDYSSQQRRTHNRAGGGLGLGLSIVRSIVKLHGGDVRVRSPGPGKGSEFIIEIPGCE